MTDSLDDVLVDWASLGAGFDLSSRRRQPIDLERLILRTARCIPGLARLYTMSATWLHVYGESVARHRLKRLIHDELESIHHPVLGLLLDTAQEGTHPRIFASVIEGLAPDDVPKPLLKSASRNATLAARAARRASDLSKQWGRWAQPVTFKSDALRPASWVMQHHPDLRTRSDFRGDLRSSVIAALLHDDDAGASESRLAACAGGSRSQVRNALRNLQLTGRVELARAESANRTSIILSANEN